MDTERPVFGKPETGRFGEIGKPDYLEIRHASKAVCLNALETFPLDVGNWTADFSAASGERAKAVYGRIMLGTRCSWVTSYRSGRVVPADTQSDFWRPNVNRDDSQNIGSLFIHGGRFASHDFKAEGDEAYRELTARFLDILAESGYDLESASISEIEGRAALRISRNGNLELSMSILDDENRARDAGDLSEADEEALRNWFEGLNQRNKQEQAAIQKTS